MKIISCDPGETESAIVVLNHGRVEYATYTANTDIINWLKRLDKTDAVFACETIQSYGSAVGQSTFTTCIWVGRLFQAWIDSGGGKPELVFRSQVKLHFCRSMRAKSANIRCVLLDRFGGDKTAVGTKKNPGPLYSVKGEGGHKYSALAIALFVADTIVPLKTINN